MTGSCRHLFLATLGAGGVLACAEPGTQPASDRQLAQASTTADCQQVDDLQFKLCWDPGEQISVAPGTGATFAGIEDAVAEWDRVLRDSRTLDLPRFVAVSNATNPDFRVDVSGGGPYCGIEEAGVITLQTNCSQNTGSFTTALVHELTEPYGFTTALESGYGMPGVSDHCVNHLAPDYSGINGSFCQHELEIIHKAYGYRQTPIPSVIADFWGKHIFTGFGLNDYSVSFTAVNQTSQISVDRLGFINAHPDFDTDSVPIGAVLPAWSSDNPLVAGVSATGLVTAVGEGSTYIRARISGTLPSNLHASGLTSRYGTAVSVNVDLPDPPPPTGFRVSDITGPATPITSAGSYRFTAHVIAPEPVDRMFWHFKYSDSGTVVQFWTNGSSATVNVHDGSYNLRVTAEPFLENGTSGTARSEDWPVCTGGGGGGGDEPLGIQKQGGEIKPNAVEGC